MKKRGLILSLILVLVLGLVGCGSSTSSSSSASSASDGGKTVIKVASDGGTAPFNFTDDDGNLQGYEVDILNEVAKRAGDIEIEHVLTEWDSIFASLDSGKVDIIANNITKKPEREEKYLFSDVAYFKSPTVIVVPKGDTSIKSLEDLQGKSIEAISGTAVGMYLEDYNEKHSDNPIELVYSDAKTATFINNVATGRYPAYICSESYVAEAEEQLGIDVDIVPLEESDDIQDSRAYFLFRKDDEELKEKVDTILKEMRDDGTLSKLCKKWADRDYTEGIEEE
ncbi:MAG: transporter substrate-binding domain-containing protein [Intestinibacter sp.]|uniref:transporter substrate-binding domain-containing protein n=1 Tax=Intestinibacter sp. TaxID=1965304 RepID=UPI003F15433A